ASGRRRGPPARGSLPRAEMLPDARAGLLARTPLPSHRPDREHVDVTTFTERDLLCPLHGLLHRVAVDEVEAAQDLFRLGEGTVRDLALSGLEADAAGLRVGTQALAVGHLPGRLELPGEAAPAAPPACPLRRLPAGTPRSWPARCRTCAPSTASLTSWRPPGAASASPWPSTSASPRRR